MESNMGGENCFLPGLTTTDFSTVDSISSSNTCNMETEDNVRAVPDIQVVAVAQRSDFELDLFGLKWKVDTVVKHIDGEELYFNALLPYDTHGNPVFLTFQVSQEQSSESGQSSSHHVAHREEVEIMENQINEISGNENIRVGNIVNNAEVESAATSILIDKNPISDMEDGNNADTTENQNVAAPPAVDIIDGSESSPVEYAENDQRPSHASSEHQEMTQKFNPHILKDGKFVPNYNNQRNSRAALAFSPHKFNNLCVPIAPIIEDNKGSRRKYICQFCRVAYPQLYKWKKHVRIHTGDDVTICSCPKCGIPYSDCRTARKHHNAAYPD